MRIALTGASGIVGGFALRAALAQGHEVTVLDRASGYVLGDAPDLAGHHALIHCAFAHVPGRYRGGEGADAQGFRRDNLDGSIRLFDAAAAAGVGRILFLSSRAVHDGHPPGIALSDDLPPRLAYL
jgi:nucleoside-diphosphate-sugar epimerase